MGIKKARRYCPQEDKLVLAEKQTPNHILHLLLSVVTMGFWIPIWIIVTIAAGNTFYCPDCASKTEWEGMAKKVKKRREREARRFAKQHRLPSA